MPRNASAMSSILLIVLLLGLGGHTNASKFSTLHYDVKQPGADDSPREEHLQEKLATIMSYHLDWACLPNDPSNPKCRASKFSWPELVGRKGREAKAVIQRENPSVDAVVYAPQDAIFTDKYCCNRVRLVMNCDAGCDYENATVFQVPIVG
ncbi:hypothetical protein C2845_PM12G03480 [Panicum miliaceum]|uniref:Uncharacterized protein n=1 Tax=Panicum miliaceum TaxID=4540 RepID=A0A3L6QKM2_PANMI|nr:hypothetical protein C2845_PM12G03480 [Panicum miliaceum]